MSFEDLISSSGLPPPGTWSWEWFAFPVPDWKYEEFVTTESGGGVLVGIILVALSYPLFHRLWSKRSQIYRKLSNEQQVVVIQHSIECIFLALLWMPTSWAMLSYNFQVPLSEGFDRARNTFVVFYMAWIVTTYFVELAARYRTIRPLVFFHHMCTAADGLLAFFSLTLMNCRCAGVLTYFITFEAPVFAGLVMYRIFPRNAWTPFAIRLGLWVFGVSRPLQLAWIIAIVVEHWAHSKAWQSVVQLCFGVLFSCIQLYSLAIHRALLRKSVDARALANPRVGEKGAPEEGVAEASDHTSSAEEDSSLEFGAKDGTLQGDEEDGLP